MKRYSTILSLIVYLASLPVFAEDPPVANKVPDYRSGDVWETSVNFPIKCNRWEGQGEKNGELVAQCGDYFAYVTKEDGNWKRFTDKDGTILAEFKPYIPNLKYPLKLGKSWEENYSGYIKDEGYPEWQSVLKVKVAAYEEISVPYGAFMAYRLDYEDHWKVGSYSGVNKGSMWISPEIKHVLKNDNKGDPRWNYELINVQLH